MIDIPKRKRGRPATLTMEERENRHRERERNRYRRKHGIPLEAPVAGSAAAPTGSAPKSGTIRPNVGPVTPPGSWPGPRGAEAVDQSRGGHLGSAGDGGTVPAADDGLEDWERVALGKEEF